MAYVDLRNLDKLPPEERAKYKKMLEAYPHLKSKMETSRQLNTPAMAEMQQQQQQSQTADDEIDFAAIEAEQRAEGSKPPKAPPPVTMRVDPKMYQSSFEKEGEQDANKDLHRERHETREEREARERSYEQFNDILEEDLPPPPSRRQVREEPPPPPPKLSFSTKGKKHPVLMRMRAALGLDELEKIVEVELSGIKYGLRRLNRDDIVKAVNFAALRTQDPVTAKAQMEAAAAAFSVRTIDGVAVEDVFEVPLRERLPGTKDDIPVTSDERLARGHQAMYDFMAAANPEFTELLVTYYEQHFPTIDLKAKDTSLALCPTENCGYKALINQSDKRFCPLHGLELVAEQKIQNPF